MEAGSKVIQKIGFQDEIYGKYEVRNYEDCIKWPPSSIRPL